MKKVLNTILTYTELGLRIAAKLLLLVPLILAMAWFSFRVDRSGLFQGEKYELAVANALLNGENLTGYDQMDERKILTLYADRLPEAVDTIALGSSRVLQYTTAIAGSESFFNCGMSGADFYDILNSYYTFEKAGKIPKNVVICLDAWLFNANEDAYNPRSDRELYAEFLSVALGYDTGYVADKSLEKYLALLEPSYFQGSLDYYLHEREAEPGPQAVQGDLYSQPGNVKRYDGSVLYDVEYRTADLDEIEYRARQQAGTFVRMDDFHQLDAELIQIFDAFIHHMQDQGVNVIFLLVPYHPLVYNYATENAEEFDGFFLSEAWYTEYARANNIPLYGSYNPFVTDTTETGFYDGLHITGEGLAAILPTIREIQTAQQSGAAGSSWLYSGEARVAYETAERITTERYAIGAAAPETLERGEDAEIHGEASYILLRYNEGGTLLARYAVTMSEGIVYRLATDIGEWVVDPRF